MTRNHNLVHAKDASHFFPFKLARRLELPPLARVGDVLLASALSVPAGAPEERGGFPSLRKDAHLRKFS